MTTICWDGKELVTDSRLSIIRSDENQRMIAPTSMEDIKELNNDAVKIIEPKHFTLDGDVVLAIAIAGDARLIESLMHLDTTDTIGTHSVTRELYDDAFYGQYSDLFCKTELIVIAKTTWGKITMEARPDGSLVDFSVELFARKGDTTQWAMGGSGFQATLVAISHPKMANCNVTLAEMKTKSARKCVTFAIICDALSGGPLRVWSEDKGIETVEIDAGAAVMKEYLELNKYSEGMLPLEEAFAIQRRNEILAERAAKQSA